LSTLPGSKTGFLEGADAAAAAASLGTVVTGKLPITTPVPARKRSQRDIKLKLKPYLC